jgi:hypothetical protein
LCFRVDQKRNWFVSPTPCAPGNSIFAGLLAPESNDRLPKKNGPA